MSSDPIHLLAISLLNQCKSVVSHQRELHRSTGMNFNLFQLLGVAHYEVSTHSMMLAELLSPDGSHGQGANFLKIFVAAVKAKCPPEKQKYLEHFEASEARVRTEVYLGQRTETDGGRLDILITDKKGLQIGIENKIYAPEQSNWVCRYRNSLQPGAPLLYLTLEGGAPFEMASATQEDVVRMSYRIDIRDWITACQKESATVPIVRESLTQYLQLIRHLTHQSTNTRMKDEIVSALIQSPETLEAYWALRDMETHLRNEVIRRLVARIHNEVEAEFRPISEPDCSGKPLDGYKLHHAFLNDHNLHAVIAFDNPNYEKCFFGFETNDGSNVAALSNPVVSHIQTAFTNEFGNFTTSGRWPAWKHWKEQMYWDDNVIKSILFMGRQFDDNLLSLIRRLKAVADHANASFVSAGTLLSPSDNIP
jgi:hypothetical protein